MTAWCWLKTVKNDRISLQASDGGQGLALEGGHRLRRDSHQWEGVPYRDSSHVE